GAEGHTAPRRHAVTVADVRLATPQAPRALRGELFSSSRFRTHPRLVPHAAPGELSRPRRIEFHLLEPRQRDTGGSGSLALSSPPRHLAYSHRLTTLHIAPRPHLYLPSLPENGMLFPILVSACVP